MIGDRAPGERRGGDVVNGAIERAARFFLAPAAPERPAVAAPAAVARAVVLGTAADAVPLAAALALSSRLAGAGPALVAVWPSDGSPRRGVATRAAARLAALLSARELAAGARGRLVWLALPPDPGEAAAAVRSASAIVDGPLVTALAGPRPPELETLVAEHDLAVVAAPPETALARAAVARLAAAGVAAAACAPPPRGPLRTLATAGVAGPRLAEPLADGRR
jgi:hypothetical protein